MKKFYTLEVGENEYKFRLSLAVQKRLSEKYKDKDSRPNALQIVTMGCDDPTVMGDVLAACANWDGKNPISADDIYDDLLEAGMVSGTIARTKIMMDIAVTFGLVTMEQAEAFIASAYRNVEDNIRELNGDNTENDGQQNNAGDPMTA